MHGNRGHKPKHTIGPEVREQVLELARTTYAGCNQQHLRDLLQEREGIVLSRASVHRILQAGQLLAEPKRRKAQHRRRRKRYAQEGMLVQIDGSRHPWLGDRGGFLSLLATIDDATGKLNAAVFREQEDAASATFCWCARWWNATAVPSPSPMIAMASLAKPGKRPRRRAFRSS